jgi:hypothetical protein
MARRKRKDPDASVFDGADVTRDVVIGKEPGKAYAFVLPGDDMAKYISAGAVRTERREGGARPAIDDGSSTDSGYAVNGQLILMELPEERAEAMQRGSERKFAKQYQGNRESLMATRANSLGSLGPDPSVPMSFRATA